MIGQTISASLPKTTVYVSGTVNDVITTWTLNGDLWQTVADRAEDETYNVKLSIVSSSGQTTQAEFTLYYGLLYLITDRTQADVDRVQELYEKIGVVGWGNITEEEQEEWNSGMRGSYNCTDLNRVGNAVSYVAGRLEQYGYPVTVTPKINWTEEEIPYPGSQELEEYLENIRSIRSVLNVASIAPTVPEDMQELTYIEANNIEQILLDVNKLIDNMISNWIYCNQIYCGGGFITNAG